MGISDDMMMELFVSANIDILETMKKDTSLSDELNRVTNNEKASKKEKDVPTRCLSSPTTESTHQPILLSSSKSGTDRLQSPSQPCKSSSGVKDESRKKNSVASSRALTTNFNRQEEQKTHDFSCDDMDLDL